MLTQTMPALARALDGSVSPQAARAMMQALGNCGQDVVQRGGMAVLPPLNLNGWNPYDTPNIDIGGGWIPSNELGNPFIDMPPGGGFRAGDWHQTTVGSPINNLSTPIINNITNVLGAPAPIATLSGPIQAPGVITQFVQVPGEDGALVVLRPPEEQGATGPPGADGTNGSEGRRGPSGPPGFDGFAQNIPVLPVRRKFVVDNVNVQRLRFRRLVVNVEFDSDACDVVVQKQQFPPFVTNVTQRKHTLSYYGPDNGLG